jgi:hypothetical protein
VLEIATEHEHTNHNVTNLFISSHTISSIYLIFLRYNGAHHLVINIFAVGL